MADSELALINKVDLRIALAADDKQFELALKLYLSPVLLKLSSPYADNRKAVLKIIQNVIPRITAARDIKLPVESLLEQVKHPKVPNGADASSVRLYSLLFISRGIDRLNDTEKRELVPKVLEGINEFPDNVTARLFNILTKLLTAWKCPDSHSAEYETMNEFLTFDKNPLAEKFVLEKIAKFLMLRPNPGPVPVETPGLSVADNKYFTVDAGVAYKTQQEIFAVKKQLLEFLKCGFKADNLTIPLLIASVDESSAINDSSEVLYRKLHFDTEDEKLISQLVSLFIGDSDSGIPPVKDTLQDKILQILLKSKTAATSPKVSSICTLGLASEYSRLKQTTVQFIKWVSQHNSEEGNVAAQAVKDFNTNMAAQLKDNLKAEGWPQIDISAVKNYAATINQRTLQYEALGNILKANPELFKDDFSYVEFLFQSLEGENADLRATIQDALSGLTVHLPSISTDGKLKIKEIAKSFFQSDIHQELQNLHACRFAAIKYVNCAFPFNDPTARYLNILGTGKENRADTIEEAIKGLHPHWFNILQSSNTLEFKKTSDLLGENSTVEFPNFSELIYTLHTELVASKHSQDAPIYKSLGKAVEFSLQTLVMQAIKLKSTVVVPDEEWSVRLEKALEFDKQVQGLLIDKINQVAQEDSDMASGESENPFNLFLSIIFDSFSGQYVDGARISSDIIFGSVFVTLLSLSPPAVIGHLVELIPKLLDLLNGKFLNDVTTSQVCRSFGIIASHPANSDGEVTSLLEKLSLKDTPRYLVKGRLLASGYLISRLVYRGRVEVLAPTTVQNYVGSLLTSAADNSLESTVAESIGQLAIFGSLGPSLELYSTVGDDAKKLVEILIPKVKKGDEKSVVAFSQLSLAFADKSPAKDEDLNQFEKAIYDTHVSKQIEYIFTSGEALLIIAGGWDSKALQRSIDIQSETIKFIPQDTSRVPYVLGVILKACANTKPSLRKAGCIWLLSFAQYLGHLDYVRNKSREIHIAFMRFLADRDELVQESASRGLSIVYEMGDVELKETLVKGLLKSFTDSNSSSALSSGTVEEDTELFDKDILKTNDGSVSTYKDVLNLASDVGDPSLVYKFMSLAKSSALWSSRKGMAFGLGSILSKSSLDEMLSSNKSLSDRLIPKLYRYKFDPSTSVSKSMNDIWNALIKDSSKTINDNFDAILKELLKSMGNKEWRVRQASTLALNDLLQIVTLDKYEDKIEDIWNMSFRVMDDIKESVRKEGTKLTRTLSTILTRTADVKDGGVSVAKATEVLSSLIPFLLGLKGLLSEAEDIRNFALLTILKLCKIGGVAIKPFIPKLLDNFIGLMSTLEPEIVNYLVLNADKYQLKNNEIDAKRLQSLGNSPMMDAIEKLLDILDESLMPETIKVLQSSIKKSVGLPSKVCGSRVLVSLVTKHYAITKPYGDALLKLCISQIKDRNDTISSSYATAAGYLCRIASVDSIIKYSEVINDLYFVSEVERNREIAAWASEGVSKYAGHDKFETVASAFLPLAYIGQNDTVKLVAKIFEREWIENSSGNNAVKLYLQEICKFAESYLNSNQYHIRQIIARSIANLCNAIDEVTSKDFINVLFDILIEACKGKSWAGKEVVLEALVSFLIKSSSFIKADEDLFSRINKVVLTEAKRRNRDYQKHSIKLLGKYLHTFNDTDLLDSYLQIMGENILADDYYEDDDDDDAMQDVRDSRDQKVSKSTSYNLKIEEERLSFIKNLFDTMSNENLSEASGLLELALKSIINLFQSPVIENTWRSKVESNECLKSLLSDELKVKYSAKDIKTLADTWQELYKNCVNLNNIERVKVESIRNAKRLVDLFEELHALKEANTIVTQVKIFKNVETSTIVQNEIDVILNR